MLSVELSIAPYVRDASIPVRTAWYTARRRLLDYLIMYIQEGEMIAHVEGWVPFRGGRLLPDPAWRASHPGGSGGRHDALLHLDVFHNSGRERSFVVRSGRVDVSGHGDLMQPRLDEAAGVRVPTGFVPPHPAPFRDTMLKAIGIWQRRDFLGQLEAHYLATGCHLSFPGYSSESSESAEEPEFLNWIT